MFNSKYFSNIILLLILTNNAESQECNKILIEGGENAVKKIFNDFNDIKTGINDLKLNQEYCQENNSNKSIEKVIPFFDERFDQMAEKCYKTILPKDCATATDCIQRSGIYKIQIGKYSNEPFYVACDQETDNGNWLIIQKRQDGSVDFNRNWQDYETGFGDIEGEFFIGLKKLYALTNYNGPQELLIVMEDENSTTAYAKYQAFAIGNETESYKLKRLGKYSGTAGNSLQLHVGMKFSTKDRDNDLHAKASCAVVYLGAWWYNSCHHSNLNGKYGDNTHGKGINWRSFRGHTVSLPYVKMMIRRSILL